MDVKTTKRGMRLAAALVCLILATSAAAAPQVDPITWSVITGGGGTLFSGSIVVQGTLGQPSAGSLNLPPLELTAGFWALPATHALRLPLVMR